MLLSKYMQLNCQSLSPTSETSELNGMKNFAIQNRVLQRDRVLQRRVLERYYCISTSITLKTKFAGLFDHGYYSSAMKLVNSTAFIES